MTADVRRGMRRGWHWAFVLALWCVTLVAMAAPPPAGDSAGGTPQAADTPPAPRIGVLTMLPGEIFFERFGHNAIVVQDPVAGTATSYNFGYFDPSESDFIARFVSGEMRYRLLALPVDEDLAYYRDVGRGGSMQWLDLGPAGPLFAPVLVLVAGLATLAVFVYGLQVLPQRNAHWIALLLPVHTALAWALVRTPGRPRRTIASRPG